MARNRLIYQSELLFASNDASATGTGSHVELRRVQSANYGFTISRQDVNEYGQLASIDRLILDPPVVNTDFSYYLTDGFNERALGFYVRTGSAEPEAGFASGHLEAGSGVNLFVTVYGEGEDAAQSASHAPDAVIGVGNAYLSDWTLDLSVGSLPTVSVTMEAANINADVAVGTGDPDSLSGIESPAVDTADGTKLGGIVYLPWNKTVYEDEPSGKISALRPGDITVTLSSVQGQVIGNIGGGADQGHIQSASISVPLSRSSLTKLGTKFDYAKVVDFPVVASLSVSAIVNEVTAKNLVDILDQAGSTVTLALADPNDTSDTAVRFSFKNAKIDSESFSSSIGADKTVDMTFTTQIGSATDTVNGVFMSGKNDEEVLTEVR